jgi:RNA polymerase sigma-70 factor (ECF subfamily)
MDTDAVRHMGWPAEMVEHLGFLRRLAVLQVGSQSEAEDAVQDTLVAAMSGLRGYSGDVPMRAWLVGILRHKVIDIIRKRRRFVSYDMDDASSSDDLSPDGMFTAQGDWNPAQFNAADCPQHQVAQRQLLDLVELCMHALPAPAARVFLMREYLGMETDEIVAQTSLAPGNLRVTLHRARLRLRACVVRGWGEFL